MAIFAGENYRQHIEITEQVGKLGFYSNSVVNKLQVELAERLGKLSGYDDYQLFLINSGAEATEQPSSASSNRQQARHLATGEASYKPPDNFIKA